MERPSKKEIKAAVDKLKDKPTEKNFSEIRIGNLPSKKSSQRIRKQGI